MTKFVEGGPDIPPEVEKALAEERLVFFCGAGISYYMDLPLFGGLVRNVCDQLDIKINEHGPLKSAFCEKKYDSVFSFLENSEKPWFRDNPSGVREAVIRCLEGYDARIPPDTHKALLELSTCRDGGYRLITTNFDRLFFEAGLNLSNTYCAPFLPPLSHINWDKVSFLHGVIDCKNDPKGKTLVLTKGDFAATYINDGRTTSFATKLFEEFTVLMVGYSLNDPIMEYLISAASDKRVSSVFALADHDGENCDAVMHKWEAKGVTPIPYDNGQNYAMLHDTLREWARLNRLHKEHDGESINEEKSDSPTRHEIRFRGGVHPFGTKSVAEIRVELLEAPAPQEENMILRGATNGKFRSLATMQPEKAISVLDSLSLEEHKGCSWILYAALNGIVSIGDQNKPSKERSEFLYQVVKHLISEEYLIDKCRSPLTIGMQKDAAMLSKMAPENYFYLWRRILNFVRKDQPKNESGMEFDPLNTDAGKLGWALMDIFWSRYFGTVPPDNKIPVDLLPFFDDLVQGETDSVLPAFYHLGMNAFPLYYVDPNWTRKNLFPLMNWENPRLAEAAWSGYLFDRRMNNNFFREIKPMFLAAIKYYGEDTANDDAGKDEIIAGGGDNPDNLARMFFGICCEVPRKFFEPNEIKEVMGHLNVRQLGLIAWCMWKSLDRAGDKAGALWEERIGPWFTRYWPKTAHHQTDEISIQLIETALACREQFPAALKAMKFVYPIKERSFPLFLLEENKDGKYDSVFKFPLDLLELLYNIVTEENKIDYERHLEKTLDRMLEQDKTLEKDPRYQRLRGYVRKKPLT